MHVHSTASDDSGEAMENSIACAIAKGLDTICFTDHLDIRNGRVPSVPFPEGYPRWARCIDEYATIGNKYAGTIDVLLGAEIAEIPQDPALARDYASRNNLDFILGSIHALPGEQDFYLFKFETQKDCEALAIRYLDENIALAELNIADSIAHIGYINRYMANQGFGVDLMQYKSRLEKIFTTQIKNGKAIEINTSGLRQAAYGQSFPNVEILALYHKLGGRLITIGSDAHSAADVAGKFDVVADIMKDVGFTHYTVFKKRTPALVAL